MIEYKMHKEKKSGYPKYCYDRSKKDRNTTYFVFERKHYRVRLPHPSSPDFQAAYDLALKRSECETALSDRIAQHASGMNRNELDQYFAKIEAGARQRARAAGREYALPKHWGADQYVKQGGICALTGFTMTKGEGRLSPYSPSIDRIDSAKGYTPENCQLTILHANLAKRDMGENEFVKMCLAVVLKRRATEREHIKNVGPDEGPSFSKPSKNNNLAAK